MGLLLQVWAIYMCLGKKKYISINKTLIWISLLNHYKAYRQISTIGEIHCLIPKRCNSLLTQNLFYILGRILRNYWCLDATFSNWPQVSSMFRKTTIVRTNKSNSDFQLWTKTPWTLGKNTRYWKRVRPPPPPPRKQSPGAGGGDLIFF